MIKEFKKQIIKDLLKDRYKKYKWYLIGLNSFRYISSSVTKGDLLETYYCVMRYIDDVADGDVPIPEPFKSRPGYIEDKIEFSKKLSNPKDSIDHLLLYCFKLAAKINIDISAETDNILLSLHYDAQRYKKNKILTEKELKHHYFLLDIKGTIRCTLKIFGDDAEKFPYVKPAGVASRTYYDLRDYEDDVINKGFINISAEDIEKYKIKDIKNQNSEEIKKYFHDTANWGLYLIEEYKRRAKQIQLKNLGKAAVWLMHTKPATRYFNKILNQKP